MKNKNTIELSWTVEDVHEKRPELTLAECQEVLASLEDASDASVGITWDTLEDTAERIFPEEERESGYTEEEQAELDARFEAEIAEYKKNQPRGLEIERDDEDGMVTVTYPDNFQVVIDRRENSVRDIIEVRVWKLGQDEPLDVLTVAHESCDICKITLKEVDVDANGYCVNCRDGVDL